MKLKDTQSAFLAQMQVNEIDKSDLSFLQQDESVNLRERFGIYLEGYSLRLIEAMMDTYPALHTLLGDEDFESLCIAYIKDHPSTHFSLRYYGSELLNFICDNKLFEEMRFIHEMVEFEWKLRHAFDAKNSDLLTPEQLKLISPEKWPQLKFSLLPSFSQITFNWNTPTLWKAIIQEAPPQAPDQLSSQQHWIIWRPALETQFISIEPRESELLALLENGVNFETLCEMAALEYGDESENIVINFLSNWLNYQVLEKINEKD